MDRAKIFYESEIKRLTKLMFQSSNVKEIKVIGDRIRFYQDLLE